MRRFNLPDGITIGFISLILMLVLLLYPRFPNGPQLLAGFGNNGGEEFLSYLMTSESLVIAGGREWNSWNNKMKERLGTIQNQDGSWSGHHCITSPVFCTAAVLQVLTTERDVELLKRVAKVSQK